MKLKRTHQCDKCPWRVDVDPLDIPDGYSVERHEALVNTIARDDDPLGTLHDMHAMACHKTGDAHCVGWLMNQLGVGNNIGLRFRMRDCENLQHVKLIGEQHACFEDTLPTLSKDNHMLTENTLDVEPETPAREYREPRTTVRFDADLRTRLQRHAKEKNISQNTIVNTALMAYFNQIDAVTPRD